MELTISDLKAEIDELKVDVRRLEEKISSIEQKPTFKEDDFRYRRLVEEKHMLLEHLCQLRTNVYSKLMLQPTISSSENSHHNNGSVKSEFPASKRQKTNNKRGFSEVNSEESEPAGEIEYYVDRKEHHQPVDSSVIPLIVTPRLADGVPRVEQHITQSGGSIPLPQDHAPCDRQIFPDFLLCKVDHSVLQFPSRIWGSVPSGRDFLSYATESTLVKYVNIFLEDILKSMNLPLQLENHLGIKHITQDICVLTFGNRLVGVVEVKKPGDNILLEPTVLGELFDQLLLIEGFYGSGPVIGILTSFEEWLFSWFTPDSKYFTHPFIRPSQEFFTQVKASSAKEGSPVACIPSQLSGWEHGCVIEDELLELEEEFILSDSVARILSTTNVFNIYRDYDSVFQHIYSTFLRMANVKFNFRTSITRTVFTLHKDNKKITWHPISEIPIDLSTVSSSKFPRKSTKVLLAIEDLGRGSSGKAWLTCTLSRNPAICVLKFSNKGDSGKSYLDLEKSWWDKIYPEFSQMTKVETWSGSCIGDASFLFHTRRSTWDVSGQDSTIIN